LHQQKRDFTEEELISVLKYAVNWYAVIEEESTKKILTSGIDQQTLSLVSTANLTAKVSP